MSDLSMSNTTSGYASVRPEYLTMCAEMWLMAVVNEAINVPSIASILIRQYTELTNFCHTLNKFLQYINLL